MVSLAENGFRAIARNPRTHLGHGRGRQVPIQTRSEWMQDRAGISKVAFQPFAKFGAAASNV